MRKLISVFAALSLALSLAACGSAGSSSAPAAGHPADAGALEGRVAKIERYLRELSKRGFKSAPAKSDTGQVWGKVVSALVEAGHKQAAMAASDAAVEETDDTVTVRIGSPASMSLIDTPEIRAAIDKAFSAVSVKRLALVQGGAMVHDREVEYLKQNQKIFGGLSAEALAAPAAPRHIM